MWYLNSIIATLLILACWALITTLFSLIGVLVESLIDKDSTRALLSRFIHCEAFHLYDIS